MEELYNKLSDIESKTNKLIKELEIKFTAKRIFSFATLNLLDYADVKSFKVIASENYKDLKSKTVKHTAVGTDTVYKKKTTKHQIFLLGNRKLQKLSKEDAIAYLQKAFELIALYKQYNAVRKLLISTYEYTYAENISAENLFTIEDTADREQSVYVSYRRALPNDSEYKKWSQIILDLEDEDKEISNKRDEELSYK